VEPRGGIDRLYGVKSWLMENDGFQLITKGHRLCAKKVKYNKSLPVPGSDNLIDVKELISRILEKKTNIESDLYVESIKEVLKICKHLKFKKIVCYGIGKISDNISSQYQLAVLLILRDMLIDTVEEVLVYDPLLCEDELSVIEELKLINIGHNEKCRHAVTSYTLFYLPHGSLQMYNNLLYANWSLSKLSMISIIGNSFSNYYLRLTDNKLITNAFYLHQLKDHYMEITFPSLYDSFNDTSVHVFPLTHLQSLPSDIWMCSPEPTFDLNDEMIISDY
jgi:hypothetical protein